MEGWDFDPLLFDVMYSHLNHGNGGSKFLRNGVVQLSHDSFPQNPFPFLPFSRCLIQEMQTVELDLSGNGTTNHPDNWIFL